MTTTTKTDKPWVQPAVGDKCMTLDGKRYRSVTRVTEYQPARGSRLFGTVWYTNQHGREADCWITTWVDWCSRAVRDGGRYVRAGEMLP